MKKVFLLITVLFSILLYSCNEISKQGDNHMYIFEDTYGEQNRLIVRSEAMLMEQNNENIDVTKYNDIYFSNNDLIIFNFKTSSDEKDLKVLSAKRIDEDILIEVSLKTKLTEWDMDLIEIRLYIEVPKYIGDLMLIQEKVGILVKNANYTDVYYSHYYDCRKKK